jgi:SsrA-binding protein
MAYAENQKIRFDYEIVDHFTGGLVLLGNEVKSIRNGKVSIKGAYVKVVGGELWLVGANIAPYQPNNTPKDYDAHRSRKILVTRRELDKLIGTSKESGLTLVPLKLFGEHGKIKLDVGIGRGKKKHDKREKIKKRDTDRDISRALKSNS